MLVVFVFCFGSAIVRAADRDLILLELGRDGNPVVEYKLSDGANLVAFTDSDTQTHALVRSALWEPLTACTSVYSNLEMKLLDCPRPRFQLLPDKVVRDRRYPPVIKLQNGGSLVFTQYLQSIGRSGFTDWLIKAPKRGVVVYRDRKSESTLEIKGSDFQKDMRGWIYFGPDTFTKIDGALVLMDSGLPNFTTSLIAKNTAALLNVYTERLGKKLPASPSIYVVWEERDKPGQSFQADVVPGGVIRFGLRGEAWATESAERSTRIISVLAHELAHLWNAGVFMHEKTSESWLYEGNAELLSVAALYAIGALDEAAVTGRVSHAFSDCAIQSAGRPWGGMKERFAGQIPYVCGFALNFLAAGPASADGLSSDVLGFWRAFWDIHPSYSQRDLESYLAKTRGDLVSNNFSRVFTDATTPLNQHLVRLLQTQGHSASTQIELSKSIRSRVASNVFREILRDDCGPNSSAIGREAEYEVVECVGLKKGTKLAFVNSINIYDRTMDAVNSISSTCARDQKVRVSSGSDELVLNCSPIVAERLKWVLQLPNVERLAKFGELFTR